MCPFCGSAGARARGKGDLASYFGVTESGLSRIAARVRDEDEEASDLAWEDLDWASPRTLTHP